MATGRERAWDIDLEGLLLRVAQNDKGVPLWTVDSVPFDGGEPPSPADVPRRWTSWHAGCGYNQVLVPDTYHYTINMDASHPRQLIMGPYVSMVNVGGVGNVNGFFEQSSALYALAGRYVKGISLTSPTTTFSKDFGDARVTAAANFDGSTLVMAGNSYPSWTFTGTTWTENTDSTDVKGAYLAPFYVSGTGYVLARSYLGANDDPAVSWLPQGTAFNTLSAWVGSYDVGDDGQAITGLAARERTLWVGKADGLYYVDASGRTPKVLGVTPNSNNGINLMVDSGGKVWYPSVEGFFRYDSNTGECVDVSPGRGLGNEWPIYGRCTAQAEYRRWHYAAFYNGSDSYIMRGREREQGEPGVGPIIWHGALVFARSTFIGAMHISHLSAPPRLYFGWGSNAAWIDLPSDGDNPLADTRYKYATSGSLYLPTDDWGQAGSNWAVTGFQIENEGLNREVYASLYIKRNHGDLELIQHVMEPGQGHVNIHFGNDVLFNRMSLRLDVTNPAPSQTPKIRAIVGRAQRRAKMRDVISTTVFCSDKALSRYGIPTRFSGLEQLTQLKNYGLGQPVELKEYWTGRERRRYVIVLPPREVLIKQQGDDAIDQGVQLQMAIMSGEGVGSAPVTLAIYGVAVYGHDRYSLDIPQPHNFPRYGTAIYGQGVYV